MLSRLLEFLREEANIIVEFLSNPDIGLYEFHDKMLRALRRYVYNTLTNLTGGRPLIEPPRVFILGKTARHGKRLLRG
jgi:hypothetical protein